MRSRTSLGVPEWFRDKELYMGSRVSAIGKVSGVTGIVPGPPEGSRGSTEWATYPGGPHGLKWEGNQPLVGWCAPLAPLRLGLETLGVGGASTCLGGQATPLAAAPPPRDPISRAGAPLGSLYKEGAGRAAAPNTLAPPSPLATPLPLAEAWRSPAEIAAASTATPLCCWIFINLSFPLAGSRRRRRLPNHMCVERGGAVHSALGSSVI